MSSGGLISAGSLVRWSFPVEMMPALFLAVQASLPWPSIMSWILGRTYVLVYIFGSIRRTDFLPVQIRGMDYSAEVLQRSAESDADEDSMDEGIEFIGSSALAKCLDVSESEDSDAGDCHRFTPSCMSVDF